MAGRLAQAEARERLAESARDAAVAAAEEARIAGLQRELEELRTRRMTDR
jgi:hypothetical protein